MPHPNEVLKIWPAVYDSGAVLYMHLCDGRQRYTTHSSALQCTPPCSVQYIVHYSGLQCTLHSALRCSKVECEVQCAESPVAVHCSSHPRRRTRWVVFLPSLCSLLHLPLSSLLLLPPLPASSLRLPLPPSSKCSSLFFPPSSLPPNISSPAALTRAASGRADRVDPPPGW